MTNIDHGMNIGEVTSLATQLSSKASEIAGIRNALNSLVSGSDAIWRGPDANNFRSEWTSTLSTQLTQVENALNEFSRKAQQNIQQQQSTSAG